MTLNAQRDGEVVLNGVKFPIIGNVRESLISRFPAKMTTGDYEYSNERIASNWIINDQRGGMLVEEMDESVHSNRHWYSTCDTRFRSNIMLPPLATDITDLTNASSYNATPSGASGWTNSTNAIDGNTATYASVTCPLEDYSAYLTLTFTAVSCSAIRYYVSRPDATYPATIDVDAYYGSAWNNVFEGAYTQNEWITKALGSTQTVSSIRIRFNNAAGTTKDAYIHEVQYTVEPETDYFHSFVDFNGENYMANANQLCKLDSDNAGQTGLQTLPASITNLLVSSDGYLLIFLGDSTNYWYMSTAEAFTKTNTALANKGLRWDGKTWKMAVNGRWWYSTDPGSATPTWAAGDASGGLDDYNVTPKSLINYFDADGNLIPYCATTSGLWAYDMANSMWVETSVSLPEHDQTGLGLVNWQDALFVSGGTSVIKYVAGSTAVVDFHKGLDQDDSLPALRGGEIVKFIKGYNEFFALVDSTYEGATSYSQVVSYDGTGWRTWWEATAVNKNMYPGIVTSVNKHQLLFSTTDGIYSIPLQRASPNPKKVSGYTYATAGIHISPRFDAGTKVFPKLATKLTLFLDDMSADETVSVSYQIDQAQGSLASAWTSLVDAQTADGVVETKFGSSLGIEFYDIQFRTALTSGTSTLSPIIKGMVLSYIKLLDAKKQWNFTINLAEAGLAASTQKTLHDSLATILATNTLMTFTYRDGSSASDTHYVIVQPYQGSMPTGPNWDSIFNLTVVEI